MKTKSNKPNGSAGPKADLMICDELKTYLNDINGTVSELRHNPITGVTGHGVWVDGVLIDTLTTTQLTTPRTRGRLVMSMASKFVPNSAIGAKK